MAKVGHLQFSLPRLGHSAGGSQCFTRIELGKYFAGAGSVPRIEFHGGAVIRDITKEKKTNV